MSRPDHCPSCGHVYGNPRSLPDHKRFMKVIDEAERNWPHDHEFQPIGLTERKRAKHLRAYLLVECGYVEATSICEANPELVSLQLAIANAASSRKGDFAFVRVIGGWITVLRPKSINFATLPQRDFVPLRQAVEECIEIALGMDTQELLRAEAA